MQAHPSGSATPVVDAVLALLPEATAWLTDFDVRLLRAQERHSLSKQDPLRAAHCLWCRVKMRIVDRCQAGVRPRGEGMHNRFCFCCLLDDHVQFHCVLCDAPAQPLDLQRHWLDLELNADGASQHLHHAAAAEELLKPWLESDERITGLPDEALEHVRMFLRWRLAQALPDDDLVEYARQRVESTRKQWQSAHVIQKVPFELAGIVHAWLDGMCQQCCSGQHDLLQTLWIFCADCAMCS